MGRKDMVPEKLDIARAPVIVITSIFRTIKQLDIVMLASAFSKNHFPVHLLLALMPYSP